MSGAFLETYAFVEVLKSWWNHGKQPQLYYYRDKDGREVDLLIAMDGKLYPIEIKKSATPRPEWASLFRRVDQLGARRGDSGVVCLCRDVMPLDEKTTAIPVGLL